MGGMFFEVYQLKENWEDQNNKYQNQPAGQNVVDLNSYTLVSSGHFAFEDDEINAQAVLDELTGTLSLNRLDGFKKRNVSFSDIVVLNGETAFYCQKTGWLPINVINREEALGGISQ